MRRNEDLAALLGVIHSGDPKKLHRDLTGARRRGFTRTGTGRQPTGGVSLGRLMQAFGAPKVKLVKPGAAKRGD